VNAALYGLCLLSALIVLRTRRIHLSNGVVVRACLGRSSTWFAVADVESVAFRYTRQGFLAQLGVRGWKRRAMFAELYWLDWDKLVVAVVEGRPGLRRRGPLAEWLIPRLLAGAPPGFWQRFRMPPDLGIH
jgi:hypothetical protein